MVCYAALLGAVELGAYVKDLVVLIEPMVVVATEINIPFGP